MWDARHLSFILAWFIQMGLHEGAHAWAAWFCGDDTASLLGKRSFDPFRHINWNELNSILCGVVLPVVTAATSVPMGMAWVPVNPLRFRRMRRDHAIVAAAGPAANFLLAAVMLAVHAAAIQLFLTGLIPMNVLSPIELMARAIYLTSVVYGAFNLIPLPPLDGSRILYFFLPPRFRQIMEDIEGYGIWILMALVLFGRGGRIIGPVVNASMDLWDHFL